MAGESRHYMILKAFSLGYFAIKFDLLMFSNISNIFGTISKFTVKLKVYFFVVYLNDNNKMAASVHMQYFS